MNYEDHCSFELSSKLKEKGFSVFCKALYNISNCKLIYNWRNRGYYRSTTYIYAPMLWRVHKWLREKHCIDVIVTLEDETKNPYQVEIYRHKECAIGRWEIGFFEKYEQALAEGIKRAIELI